MYNTVNNSIVIYFTVISDTEGITHISNGECGKCKK